MKAKLGKLFPPLTDVKKLHVSKEREKYNDKATDIFLKRLRKGNSKTPNEQPKIENNGFSEAKITKMKSQMNENADLKFDE